MIREVPLGSLLLAKTYRCRVAAVTCAIGILTASLGCSTDSPADPRERSGRAAKPPPRFVVRGAVLPSKEYSRSSGMVALLFPAGTHGQFLQARTSVNAPQSSSNVWPYDQFQKLVVQVQNQEPLSGALNDTLGAFEFPKPVVAGTYLITVGIPTTRDTGQSLPRDWPPQLFANQKIVAAGREITVAARSAWFAEVKVVDTDRSVNLGKHEYMLWPEPPPNTNDLKAIQKKLQDIEGLDREGKALENQRAAAEEKARALGQPLHLKAVRDLEAKAKNGAQTHTTAVSELDQLVQRLFPESDRTITTQP